MDLGPVVLDISSDEESGFEPKRSGLESSFDPKGPEYDWLKGFFDSDDDQTETDGDSDEVVVIGEYKPKQKPKNSIPVVRNMDDDCVLLEGDPDKPAAAAGDDDTSSSDEVMVVGEKGQVACRDYPHSRHACATFPFKTTPHEKYCDLCHCYVCDSPAPCVHWGTGISNVDHCHATDKEETWKIQRGNFKLGKSSPLLASKFPDPSLSLAPPQVNQVSPLDIIRLTPISRPTNQISRPAASRVSPANFCVPPIISQGRSQRSGLPLSKTRVQPGSMPGPLLGSGTNISRGKVPHIGIPGRRVVSSRSLFKRPGSVGGTLQVNQFTYNGPSNNLSNSSEHTRSPAPTAVPNDLNDILNTIGWDDINFSTHQTSFQPSVVRPVTSTPPSQPQIYSGPPVSHDQNIYQNVNQGQTDNESIYSFGYGNANPNGQNIFHQEIHSSVGADVGNIGYNFSNWGNNGCQSEQQFKSELSLLQSTLESPQEPSVTDSSSPFDIRSPNYFSPVDNLGFDDWHLENQSVPPVSDTSMAPQLNAFSPDPAPVDAGMLLFDFETSWNGLTRA